MMSAPLLRPTRRGDRIEHIRTPDAPAQTIGRESRPQVAYRRRIGRVDRVGCHALPRATCTHHLSPPGIWCRRARSILRRKPRRSTFGFRQKSARAVAFRITSAAQPTIRPKSSSSRHVRGCARTGYIARDPLARMPLDVGDHELLAALRGLERPEIDGIVRQYQEALAGRRSNDHDEPKRPAMQETSLR